MADEVKEAKTEAKQAKVEAKQAKATEETEDEDDGINYTKPMIIVMSKVRDIVKTHKVRFDMDAPADEKENPEFVPLVSQDYMCTLNDFIEKKIKEDIERLLLSGKHTLMAEHV